MSLSPPYGPAPGTPGGLLPLRLRCGGLVLDLPGVVNSVPGGAARDEPGRAPGAAQIPVRAGRAAGPDLREDRGADPGQRREVAGRERPLGEPEHPGVQHLGLAHVLDDLVAVPAAAA